VTRRVSFYPVDVKGTQGSDSQDAVWEEFGVPWFGDYTSGGIVRPVSFSHLSSSETEAAACSRSATYSSATPRGT
jgi:hypothetical protein